MEETWYIDIYKNSYERLFKVASEFNSKIGRDDSIKWRILFLGIKFQFMQIQLLCVFVTPLSFKLVLTQGSYATLRWNCATYVIACCFTIHISLKFELCSLIEFFRKLFLFYSWYIFLINLVDCCFLFN